MSTGKAYRLSIDFGSMEDALGFAEELSELIDFGKEVGVRMADGLDKQQQTTLLVRSLEDVEAHPGALLPLPQMDADESMASYRKRLVPLQREALDARVKRELLA